MAQWLDVGLWLADFPRSTPYLWLTCDHFVDKVSAMGQPTRPTQPPIPSGSVNEYPCNYMDYGGGGHKRQTRAAYGR